MDFNKIKKIAVIFLGCTAGSVLIQLAAPMILAAIISAAPAMDHSTMARLLKCRRRNSRDADALPFVVLVDGGFADDAFGMGGLDWENSAWRNSWTLCGRLLGSNAHA